MSIPAPPVVESPQVPAGETVPTGVPGEGRSVFREAQPALGAGTAAAGERRAAGEGIIDRRVATLSYLLPMLRTSSVQGVALVILAAIALLFALQWAQKFFIPLFFGIFITYTLNPVVVWLEKIHIPRALGSTIVMLVLLGGTAMATNSLVDQFQSIAERLPEAAQKVGRALRNTPGTIRKLQSAATELEAATVVHPQGAPVRKAAAPDTPLFKVNDWLLVGSVNAMNIIWQATVVLFLVYFLLLSGDTFKRKIVKLTGPSLTSKRTAVQILDEVNSSVQRYMFMLLVTNSLLALMMWIALRTIGLENAGAWAVTAGFLHIVPYFGPLLIIGATGLSAFMQYESLSVAFLVAGVSLAIATIVGTFVTTWMTGRIARMNPAAVFIALLFWGWLWGIWGMLLGIPIVVILKVISEHVGDMQSIADLLGE